MTKYTFRLKDGYTFENGDSIPCLDIVYHTSCPNEKKTGKKVIWVCHALTANSNPEDWWPELVGSDKLVDTEKYFVVCVGMLCSPYGSSGPASVNPLTGQPYYFDFPQVTVRDQAMIMDMVRCHLGIEKVDYMVGSSVGGYQAAEWAAMKPEVFDTIFFIATAVRVSPWLSAQIEAQKMAIEADGTFRECKSLKGGIMGLRASRALALITYRSYDGFRLSQPETDENVIFAGRAGSYERYQGKKLTDRGFDAYSYYYLMECMNSNNVGRDRGGVKKALSRIKSKTVVIAIDDDGIFVVKEMKEWASYIEGASFHVIHSDYGHDGFLLEWRQLTDIIKPMMR